MVYRTLIKSDFTQEVTKIFGNQCSLLQTDYRKVTLAIFQYNQFAKSSNIISANSIGNFLYLQDRKIVEDVRYFESYKGNIRNIFNKLEDKRYILRKDGKLKEGSKSDFKINFDYRVDSKKIMAHPFYL